MSALVLEKKGPLHEGSAIIHYKLHPSTDIWMCEHGVAYPDICEDCKKS